MYIYTYSSLIIALNHIRQHDNLHLHIEPYIISCRHILVPVVTTMYIVAAGSVFLQPESNKLITILMTYKKVSNVLSIS